MRRRPPPYPESIASAEGELIVVLAGFDRERRMQHTGWRWLEPDHGRGRFARP